MRSVCRWISKLAGTGSVINASQGDEKGQPLLAGGTMIGAIFDGGRSIFLKPDMKIEFFGGGLEHVPDSEQEKHVLGPDATAIFGAFRCEQSL